MRHPQLQLLKQQPHAVHFRVSIDQPDEVRHDAQRGWGNFKRAIDGLRLLQQSGFEVSIARHAQPGEGAVAIDASYRELLRKQRIDPTIPILPLPDFGKLGTARDVDPIGADELARHSVAGLMCSYSRMLLKKDGVVQLYACPFVDDDPRFAMGPDLPTSIATPVALGHRRCRLCLEQGACYGLVTP